MAYSRTLLSTLLLVGATACADSTTTAHGEGVIDPLLPLPDHDAELRCPPSEELLGTPFFGEIVGGVDMGPCGHVAYYEVGGHGWLIAPDASSSEFEHAAASVEFASTGDLIAWAPTFDGGLRLRGLLDGSERELVSSGSIDAYGFVPSFTAPDRSAWLWTCEQGVLARHDLDGSETVVESVVCDSVAGSSGSPRLVYADQDGRVWLADLDSDVEIGADDFEFDGSERDDTLWIDHDGELLVHVAIESSVELWARALDRRGQTVLESSEGAFEWRQANRRGAPVFVFEDGELLRFDAGVPSSIASGLGEAELAESGELFFATEDSQLFLAERSADAPLTNLGQLDVPLEIRPSRSGTVAAIEHETEICIGDGQCDQVLLALRRWTRETGFDDWVLYSTSPWELLATLDDGRMLVIGAPVVPDGLTYTGELGQPSIMFLSEQGEVQAERPAHHGALSVRQTFVLGADRLLFAGWNQWDDVTLTIAGGQWAFLGVGNQQTVPLHVWVDARGQRFAYVSEHLDGGALNYASP